MAEGKRASVSLLMIVRNEERQLAECLAPVASLFDEIVIVDTGSDDGTRRIASQFTPHVYDFPWCDDFSAARNESLRRSHGDWLFWLDADDRIEGNKIPRLRALLQALDQEPCVYLMNTACSSQYAYEGPSLITHPRLFRRHPQLAWEGRIHEQLRPEPKSLGYRWAWSDVVVRHLGYQDAQTLQRKFNRDLRLLRMDYAVDPQDTRTLVHMGLAHFHAGRASEARFYLRQVLALAKQRSDHLRQVFGALARLEMHEGKLNESLAIIDQGLALFPLGEYLLYMRADCLYDLDRYDEAQATLLQLLGNNVEFQYRGSVPADIRDKLAPRKLADILRLKRQFAQAESLFKSVLKRFPDDTLSWFLLGRLHLDAGHGRAVHEVARQLRFCPQGEVFSKLLLAACHLQYQAFGEARPLIDELIVLAPFMPLPRLLRVELFERSGASLEQRIDACRDLLRVQPGNLDAQRVLSQLQSEQSRAAAASSGWSHATVVGSGLTTA